MHISVTGFKLRFPEIIRQVEQSVTSVAITRRERLSRDRAERLIAATARAYALPLATHDGAIRQSRAVALWRI